MARIVSYRTRHFEFQVPIDKWNKKKIPLQEVAGPLFIAPSDLKARLLAPFYYDWSYETDGRITGEPLFLVYGEKWVDKEICLFPHCRELFEVEAALLKPNGFHIPTEENWVQIYNNLKAKYGNDSTAISTALRKDLGLAFSGSVYRGELRGVGSCGEFWSASEKSASHASSLFFAKDFVYPACLVCRDYGAYSVRCVSE